MRNVGAVPMIERPAGNMKGVQMTAIKSKAGMLFVSCVAATLTAAWPSWAHNLVDIARNSSGQLVRHTHIAQPFPMPESVFGPTYPGYATASLGLATIFSDDPGHGLFMVDPAANIQLIVVGVDPGLGLYNENGSAILPVGGTWHCGSHPFHQHPLWQINPGVPAQPYTIQLKLRDLSGIHTDSNVFSLSFAPKCNGDANLNGAVDIDDLVEVITSWGGCKDCNCDADFNMNCDINIDDLVIVITNWANCG